MVMTEKGKEGRSESPCWGRLAVSGFGRIAGALSFLACASTASESLFTFFAGILGFDCMIAESDLLSATGT